jgi:5-methylcytosine-specific restriction endonuclease McrA
VRREPFTIKLKFDSTEFVQEVKLKIDAGAGTIGVAAVTGKKTLYAAEVKLRSDISDKMTQRASYRRTRRGRKTRYRAPRFNNRTRKEGWLTPTLRSKLQAHEREISFVKSILPVSKTTIETASFDIHRITNPAVVNYQNGRMKGFYNAKAFVLERDSHLCQKCKGASKDRKLHVHHIVFRGHCGTDSPDNLVTMCEKCHNGLHKHKDAEKISLTLQKKRQMKTTGATQVSTICAYLKTKLEFEEAFGYETKFNRERMGYAKDHYLDAICVGVGDEEVIQLPDVIYKKARVSKGDYKQTAGAGSEKKSPTGKIMGFRKFDKVSWNGSEYFIKGRMSTGYAILMDIDSKKVELKPIPKFATMTRIAARNTCLISRTIVEKTLSPSSETGRTSNENQG